MGVYTHNMNKKKHVMRLLLLLLLFWFLVDFDDLGVDFVLSFTIYCVLSLLYILLQNVIICMYIYIYINVDCGSIYIIDEHWMIFY